MHVLPNEVPVRCNEPIVLSNFAHVVGLKCVSAVALQPPNVGSS